MTWRLEIRHRTRYHYRSEVRASYNEARITPLTTERQTVVQASVQVEPSVAPYRYRDYWGTVVHAFDLQSRHAELTITGTSLVETSPPPPVPTASWDALTDPAATDRFAELLAPTAYVPADGEAARVASALRLSATGPTEAVTAAAAWVRSSLRYEPGATTVSTSAAEALAAGAGVCQDFAHVTLGLLRAMGVPARYVSGYLHPRPEAALGATVTGESHAWVEAWLGEWHPLDPTSGAPVGERHVVVARGRDYADVPPFKGIYSGGPSEALGVTVELTRRA